MPNQVGVQWYDVDFTQRITTFRVQDDATNIVNDLENLTVGDIATWWQGTLQGPALGPFPPFADYDSCIVRQVVELQDALGIGCQIFIPAPRLGNFDDSAVTPLAATFVPFVAAANGIVLSGQWTPVIDLAGGGLQYGGAMPMTLSTRTIPPGTTRRTTFWADQAGQRAITHFDYAGDASTFFDQYQAFSDAHVQDWFEGPLHRLRLGILTFPYNAVEDIAVLTFSDNARNKTKLILPAPVLSMFLPDGKTVDPAAVATLVADCLGNLMTQANTVVTRFVGGARSHSWGSM
jgi:hypothetical protein